MESVIKKRLTFTTATVMRVNIDTNDVSNYITNVVGRLSQKQLLKYLNTQHPEYKHISVEDIKYSKHTLAINTQTFLDNAYLYTETEPALEENTE